MKFHHFAANCDYKAWMDIEQDDKTVKVKTIDNINYEPKVDTETFNTHSGAYKRYMFLIGQAMSNGWEISP